MKLHLTNVRLSFPELWEAKTVNGEGKPAYSATALIPRNHPVVGLIRKAQEEAGVAKWGAKWPQIKKEIEANNRGVLKDGDTKDYAGYADHFYVSARSETRPTVIDRNRSQLNPKDGRPYSGCFVNMIIDLWAQDNNYGKRINASLAGVQFVKDGEPFSGGRPASADEFEDLGDQGEDVESLVA